MSCDTSSGPAHDSSSKIVLRPRPISRAPPSQHWASEAAPTENCRDGAAHSGGVSTRRTGRVSRYAVESYFVLAPNRSLNAGHLDIPRIGQPTNPLALCCIRSTWYCVRREGLDCITSPRSNNAQPMSSLVDQCLGRLAGLLKKNFSRWQNKKGAWCVDRPIHACLALLITGSHVPGGEARKRRMESKKKHMVNW